MSSSTLAREALLKSSINTMATTAIQTTSAGPFRLTWDTDSWDASTTVPWMYYRVALPERPLPPLSDRRFKTERLTIRPLVTSDIDAFAELRSRPETQNHSTSRGRPDKDRAETQMYLDSFMSNDEAHWYFGAFLQGTGELIGEGGIPDLIDMPRSGWPEAEFLLKKEYWRQGYGTEFWEAVIHAWWDLPRELRRHQLLPAIVPGKEPGDEVEEILGFVCEDQNVPAKTFFNKMLKESKLAERGSLDTIDSREGREGQIVSWWGRVSENLRRKAADGV